MCPPEIAGLRLLVVDDETDTRELLRALLERCGVEVTVAGSAAEGLATFKSLRPDILVSDIGMPGEDGYSLIRKVRTLPLEEGGRTPAVALTAYTRAEDRTRRVAGGVQGPCAQAHRARGAGGGAGLAGAGVPGVNWDKRLEAEA